MCGWRRLRRWCWRNFFLQSFRWSTTIRCRRFDLILVFGNVYDILQSTFKASSSRLNNFGRCVSTINIEKKYIIIYKRFRNLFDYLPRRFVPILLTSLLWSIYSSRRWDEKQNFCFAVNNFAVLTDATFSERSEVGSFLHTLNALVWEWWRVVMNDVSKRKIMWQPNIQLFPRFHRFDWRNITNETKRLSSTEIPIQYIYEYSIRLM